MYLAFLNNDEPAHACRGPEALEVQRSPQHAEISAPIPGQSVEADDQQPEQPSTTASLRVGQPSVACPTPESSSLQQPSPHPARELVVVTEAKEKQAQGTLNYLPRLYAPPAPSQVRGI